MKSQRWFVMLALVCLFFTSACERREILAPNGESSATQQVQRKDLISDQSWKQRRPTDAEFIKRARERYTQYLRDNNIHRPSQTSIPEEIRMVEEEKLFELGIKDRTTKRFKVPLEHTYRAIMRPKGINSRFEGIDPAAHPSLQLKVSGSYCEWEARSWGFPFPIGYDPYLGWMNYAVLGSESISNYSIDYIGVVSVHFWEGIPINLLVDGGENLAYAVGAAAYGPYGCKEYLICYLWIVLGYHDFEDDPPQCPGMPVVWQPETGWAFWG